MAGEVGRVITAFSRKQVYLSSGVLTHEVEINFRQHTITMGGYQNSPQPIWTSGVLIEDITGDVSTNPNMFVGSTTTVNASSVLAGRGLKYALQNLPDIGTERTYKLSFPSAPIFGAAYTKEVTLWVPGKHHFYTRAEGTILSGDTKEKCIIPALGAPISHDLNAGNVWSFKNHHFQSIESDLSTSDYLNATCTGIINTHSGTTNNIPDVTFYTKEIIDSKNTFTDFKFRPDKDVDYANETHTTNWNNCGALSKISLDSISMRKEMINEGASSVGSESQHLSYLNTITGHVPNLKLSVIIQQENVGGQTVHSSLSESANANYAAILAVLNGTNIETRGYASHGYGITTWNTLGSDPCISSNITYSLITQTHESLSGANDGELEVLGTGGQTPYSYEFTGPNNFTSTSPNISNLLPGTYALKITDALGCTVGTSFVINPGPAPCQGTVTISQQSGDGCGMVDLLSTVSNLASGINSYTWEWTDLNGTIVASGNNSQGSTIGVNSITNPGLYTFTINLGNGCFQTGTTAVVSTNALTSSIVGVDVTTNGGSDGTSTVTVSLGTAPYVYLWSTGDTTAAVSGLTAGNYTVLVTDNRGCTTSSTITILEPSPITVPPNVNPLEVCMNLSTNTFTFTDNNNYIGSNNILPYKIAIKVKLVNNSSTIYSGSLSSPDIFIDNDLAALRTYNAPTKYGTNTSITILSGGTLYNDVYEITFDWNFSGGTTVESTQVILLNALSITTFNALSISSTMSYNCNDDIINSLDTTNYSINNLPYNFTRTHSLLPPTASSLISPVLSSSSSALNYTGLETDVWSNSILSNIIWDMPSTINHQEFCIIKNLTHSSNINVICYADPCVVTVCIEKLRNKLNRAICNCDENDIKKYTYISKRVGHLLAMFNITLTCTNMVADYTLLYDIIDITDCGCGCECGGCD